MIAQICYQPPKFWTPANAFGKAATIEGTLNGSQIRIQFYWTGVTEIGRDRTLRQLNEEATKFLQTYRPKHVNTTDLHFMRAGVDFKRILDPGWIPGY